MIVLWGPEILMTIITPKCWDLSCWIKFTQYQEKKAYPVEVIQYLIGTGYKTCLPTSPPGINST